ncbi:proton-coupled amino acid transporter 2-like [Melitaea cinxia]|uniref:proton-coupled amino acid transporter 2-like n=1 Tax=Melitaea cinxia TaxID=113334 RepID=UPI001E26FC6E|nr:proton-coupled amino acid transporter 2-like [Melitaea cinxia]
MVKGALGGGILGGHVAYMKAGIFIGLPFNLLFGMYMTYCLYILVISAQILYRRTRVPSMSYPDVGEAAMACFPNPKVAKYSKIFRYTIDAIICIDLFGACACYQIIIAKSIKQLVEDTQRTTIEGLAPVFCIMLTVYYAFVFNPTFSNLVKVTKLYNFFEYVGMSVFSMSCSGVVIPIENNMKDPKKYPQVLMTGMSLIIMCTFSVSFFGYVGFLDACESPITVNFPMTLYECRVHQDVNLLLKINITIDFKLIGNM